MNYTIDEMKKILRNLPDRFIAWAEQAHDLSLESKQAITITSAFFTICVRKLIDEGNLKSAEQGIDSILIIYKQFGIPDTESEIKKI